MKEEEARQSNWDAELEKTQAFATWNNMYGHIRQTCLEGRKQNIRQHQNHLRNNLLPVSAITNKGCSVHFGSKGACIKRVDGSTALTARKHG